MIIVTGGAGFIGSNIVASLLERRPDADIVVCDHLLESEHKYHNLEKHKIREVISPDQLLEYLEKHKKEVEVIFHMGAISSTVETNETRIMKNNFDLPLALWNWCCKNGVRYLYASSAATYGDGSQGFVDDESIEYLSSLKPLNLYGQSKNRFDIEAVSLAAKKKAPIQWAGFKFFNVYGPNEYHKGGQMSVARQMHQQALSKGKVRLFKSYRKDYKDGGQLRDFIYVRDCCDVLLWFYDNKQVSGIFNVGTGKARSFKDLAAALYKSLGKDKANIEYFDMPEQIRDKYQYFTQASTDKLRENGYKKAFTSLEEGVSDYVRNYLNAKDPYR